MVQVYIALIYNETFPQVTGLTPDYTYSEAPPYGLLVKAPRYNNFLFPDLWW